MKNNSKLKAAIASLIGLSMASIALTSCGSRESNDPESDLYGNSPGSPTPPYPPLRQSELRGEKNFATLINKYAQGKIEPTPWAGFWWPYTGNGIAAGGSGGSPAGKYDAARGNTTHAQEWEIRKHGPGVPQVQQWWGHCNGWCAAAALFKEPHDPVTVNGVTFGISDLKALITEAGMSTSADFFGERVDNFDNLDSPKYWDTIPNQYFLVLTNYIGIKKQAVLIDRYTGHQVWNQPLAGYRFEYPKPSDYLGPSPDAPNVYRINVSSRIWWMDDAVPPDYQTQPFNFQDDETGVGSRELRMEVWLDGPVTFDAAGKITSSGNVIVTNKDGHLVGGTWRVEPSSDAWPDYMWVPYTILKPDPEDDYANPEVEIQWIRDHLLVPGGSDDHSVNPGRVNPAPAPSGGPTNWPSSWPSDFEPPRTTTPDSPNPGPTSNPTPISTTYPGSGSNAGDWSTGNSGSWTSGNSGSAGSWTSGGTPGGWSSGNSGNSGSSGSWTSGGTSGGWSSGNSGDWSSGNSGTSGSSGSFGSWTSGGSSGSWSSSSGSGGGGSIDF